MPGADDWDGRLHAAGLRSTGPRRAVLEAVERLGHATVDELAADVQRRRPEVSLSTVYRIVQALDEAGLVTHAHLHHGSPTYHSADEDPHLHLVCHECGAVAELAVTVAEQLTEAVRDATGFRADLSHLALHGTCSRCASGSPADPTALA